MSGTERMRGVGPEPSLAAWTTSSEPWLSCEECFAQADQAIDVLLARGTPLRTEFAVHLNHCPACLDEAQSLAELVAHDYGLTQDEADARLAASLRAPGADARPA